MRSGSRTLSAIVMAAAIIETLAAHGCGGGGGTSSIPPSGALPSPPVPLIALQASTNNLVVSLTMAGEATLTAQVVDPNSFLPMSGVPVTFETSIGSLSAPVVVSDQNGIASTDLSIPAATDASSTEVSALAHGAAESLTLNILPLMAITLSASPGSAQCNGGTAGLSVVTATALDPSNAPLAGVTIGFSASGATVAPIAVTDVNGEATAQLSVTPPTSAQSVTLNAQAAGVSQSLPISLAGCAIGAAPTPTPGMGAPAAIVFVSANPTQIGVLGSPPPLPQQSTVTFQVNDANNNPLSGVSVSFFISSVGGESLSVPSAISAAPDGTVSTVLTSGRRGNLVQVTASTGSVIGTSPPVTIVGGLPVQGRMTVSAQFQNIAGNVTAGLIDSLQAVMADRFGNPIAPGASVAFQSFGGTAKPVTVSDANGIATGSLIAEPLTNPIDLDGMKTGGVVTVLATTRGETPFIDANGNGLFDPGETVVAVPEPFFDLNGNGVRDANEPFIDVNGNGKYDLSQSNGAFSQNVVVFASTRVTLSGATTIQASPGSGFVIPNGGSQAFSLQLSDAFGNPLVGGATYQITSAPAGAVEGASGTVPDGQSFGKQVAGLNLFSFTVSDSDDVNQAIPITVTVTVTSPPSGTAPGGNGNASIQINGTMN